jgi:hypothetical protein
MGLKLIAIQGNPLPEARAKDCSGKPGAPLQDYEGSRIWNGKPDPGFYQPGERPNFKIKGLKPGNKK